MPEGGGQLNTEEPEGILASMVSAAAYELAMSFGQHAEAVAELIDPGEVAGAWEVVRNGEP